jgi:hypothetical protein
MKELQGKFIYYKMGDEATDDYSEEHLFAVPPLAGTLSERGTKAILFDDLGNVLYVHHPLRLSHSGGQGEGAWT